MNIEELIAKHNLPHKMVVSFAIAVARDAAQYTDDKKVIECLDVVEGFMKGRKTKEELISARDTAYSTAYAAANAAANAAYAASAADAASTAHAAYAAADAANAAAHAAYAANAAAHAASAAHAADAAARAVSQENWRLVKESKENEYKELLLRMIRDMSELERLLLGVSV